MGHKRGVSDVTWLLGLIGSPIQLLVIGAVILLLFGHRLPGTMRSLGKGITEFKKGLREDESGEEPRLVENKSAETKA
jgi:sec-independent protein translocase protein TatA